MEENSNLDLETSTHNTSPSNTEGKNQESGGNKGIKKYLSTIREFLEVIVIAAIIVLPIRYFIFQPFIVKGDSMVPNFYSGDYLIVEELSYRFSTPQRGDVVVFKYPLDESQRFIKRVIGLPDETVEIRGNNVTISKDGNSTNLDEGNYLQNIPTLEDKTITLKSDEYFVMGDNRQFSYDSRSWGVLPKKDLIGKAMIRLFPITNLSFISKPSY